MVIFIVRVELRNAESANYEKLHDAMAEAGFYRFDKIGEEHYYLPNGEYMCYERKGTIEEVGQLAKTIAEKIRPNPRILVTKSSELFQLGLDNF